MSRARSCSHFYANDGTNQCERLRNSHTNPSDHREKYLQVRCAESYKVSLSFTVCVAFARLTRELVTSKRVSEVVYSTVNSRRNRRMRPVIQVSKRMQGKTASQGNTGSARGQGKTLPLLCTHSAPSHLAALSTSSHIIILYVHSYSLRPSNSRRFSILSRSH